MRPASWRFIEVVAIVSVALAIDPPGPARAALEEFESWSVGERERDDENGLDELHRAFAPWEDWRWRSWPSGSRVGMGCATSETWELDLDVKLRHPIGPRGEVGYRHLQREVLGESVTWSEYNGSWRGHWGTWVGATYRPSFDKELHDAGLFLRWQSDSTRWVRLHLGFEDVLNNFWDRRKSHTIPKPRRRYEMQPREWEVSGLWLRSSFGVAARGVWLSEYERRSTPASSDSSSVTELAGGILDIDTFVARGSALTWGLRTRFKRTDRTDREGEASTSADLWATDQGKLRDFFVEPWLDARISARWRLRPRGLARWSSESHRDDLGHHELETRHVGGLVTAAWGPLHFLAVEAGFAAERVRVRQTAAPDRGFFTHGTRTESRFLLALAFHGNGVALVLLESLELDREGHQGFTSHDKGFARLAVEF